MRKRIFNKSKNFSSNTNLVLLYLEWNFCVRTFKGLWDISHENGFKLPRSLLLFCLAKVSVCISPPAFFCCKWFSLCESANRKIFLTALSFQAVLFFSEFIVFPLHEVIKLHVGMSCQSTSSTRLTSNTQGTEIDLFGANSARTYDHTYLAKVIPTDSNFRWPDLCRCKLRYCSCSVKLLKWTRSWWSQFFLKKKLYKL